MGTKHVLIAGVGNIQRGDDGFGVEVAQRLVLEDLPYGTRVVEVGTSGAELVYDLLDPPDLIVVIDATARSGVPGCLYLIDPEAEPDRIVDPDSDAPVSDPCAVLKAVSYMSGRLPKARIVGCEPVEVNEGVGLSEPVQRAVDSAIKLIRHLIQEEVSTT